MPVTHPAPAALHKATLDTVSGPVEVICEQINEWLGITPVFGMDNDGKTWLMGTFTVQHHPSGRPVGDPVCVNCCRRAGQALAALPVDWSALSATNGSAWVAALDEATRRAFAEARPTAWGCAASYCPEPAAA